MRKRIGAGLQGLFFIGAWLIGQAAAQLLHIPLPAAVIALFAVLGLLLAGLLPVAAIEAGAGLLIGEMLLFFIPPLMAVLRFRAVLAGHGLQLFGAIAIGCLIVMVGTALVVERALRWEQARAAAGGTR